ncbi:MAG: membrane protein [Bacillaceae bacterium]|nr:membrane protein [Bacillaceae bacterium]
MLKKYLIAFSLFLPGLFVMSLGIVMMIYAGLGVPSWDVLHVGLQKTVGLTIGIWNQLVGIVLLGYTLYLTRKFPGIGAILNMILIGVFVDLIMFTHMLPMPATVWTQWLYMLMGIFLMGFGSGMYISSDMGAGPRDGVVLALADLTGASIRRIRTIMEIVALLLGWMLGGPVGLGTLVFSLAVGPIMQYSISFWRKIYRTMAERFLSVEKNMVMPVSSTSQGTER